MTQTGCSEIRVSDRFLERSLLGWELRFFPDDCYPDSTSSHIDVQEVSPPESKFKTVRFGADLSELEQKSKDDAIRSLYHLFVQSGRYDVSGNGVEGITDFEQFCGLFNGRGNIIYLASRPN